MISKRSLQLNSRMVNYQKWPSDPLKNLYLLKVERCGEHQGFGPSVQNSLSDLIAQTV